MDGWQRRYRLSNGPGGLGVSCTVEGSALAGVPLLAKGPGGFQARPAAEVAVLLKRAYVGAEPGAAIPPGLTKIAAALNRGDLAQAMIRAVHLRLPELDWDAAVRLARANDNLAKYSPDQPRDEDGRFTDSSGQGTKATAKPSAASGRQEAKDAKEDARRGKVNCGNGLEHLAQNSLRLKIDFDNRNIDQPIDPRLASVINSLGSIPGVESIRVSSTTGGHKSTDPHTFGNAIDINYINGVHVGDPSISGLVERIQSYAMEFDHVYNSFGPPGIYARSSKGEFVEISPQHPDLVREHSNHIHISVGCQ
ncbi:hypothetical protein [Nitrospirillum viridazoti]|uniref:hypothetical protein n=1 Tax=Nitrospirillum viridazoti TaxID=3144925 RepID=UPI00119EB258|nr:hypothetical protein [Nitrospirillum amazonense]TWB37867.1 hypothetical protein FBZ91_107180 [Nitrospirillum amazonense]